MMIKCHVSSRVLVLKWKGYKSKVLNPRQQEGIIIKRFEILNEMIFQNVKYQPQPGLFMGKEREIVISSKHG